MLANRMSNQDEDEVEDELAALEAEVTGVQLPPPPTRIELTEEQKAELAKERGRRRARERAAEQPAEPMLA
jgi:charged multivesicular body protein 6